MIKSRTFQFIIIFTMRHSCKANYRRMWQIKNVELQKHLLWFVIKVILIILPFTFVYSSLLLFQLFQLCTFLCMYVITIHSVYAILLTREIYFFAYLNLILKTMLEKQYLTLFCILTMWKWTKWMCNGKCIYSINVVT